MTNEKYTLIESKVIERVLNGELTEEEGNAVIEAALAELDETDDSVVTEGANREYRKLMKEKEPEIKKLLKNGGSAFRAKSYGKALEHFKEAQKLVRECKEAMVDIDVAHDNGGNIVSALVSPFYSFGRSFAQSLCLLIPIIGTPKYVAAYNKDHRHYIWDETKELETTGVSVETFNVYRKKLFSTLSTYEEMLDDFIKETRGYINDRKVEDEVKKESAMDAYTSMLKDAVKAGDYTIEEAKELLGDAFKMVLEEDLEPIIAPDYKDPKFLAAIKGGEKRFSCRNAHGGVSNYTIRDGLIYDDNRNSNDQDGWNIPVVEAEDLEPIIAPDYKDPKFLEAIKRGDKRFSCRNAHGGVSNYTIRDGLIYDDNRNFNDQDGWNIPTV